MKLEVEAHELERRFKVPDEITLDSDKQSGDIDASERKGQEEDTRKLPTFLAAMLKLPI